MTTPMLAFLNDATVQTKYLDRMQAHADADELVKGSYWEDGKGCAVGCIIHSSEHARFETQLGIPRTLARLLDLFFERTTNGFSKNLPLRFLRAPKLGADLSQVSDRFLLWLVNDMRLYLQTEQQRTANAGVADLFERRLRGETPDAYRAAAAAAAAAYRAAYRAAAYRAAAAAAAAAAADAAAADAAAAAAAAAAADAAAAAAAAADAAAADAAADAAAYRAAAADADAAAYRAAAAYERMANRLIELMEQAPVGAL